MWTYIEEAANIGIAGHIRPDGDCVGSCMALYLYLKKMYPEKNIDVYFETMPERFRYLYTEQEYLEEYKKNVQYDVFFSMDCSDKERLGDALRYFEQAKYTICVDHHISNEQFADYNVVVATASSTAEVLFSLLNSEEIDVHIATSLYLGMVHDSGVFKYPSTSRKTMEIAGILVEKGVATTKLIDKTFYSKTYIQNQILGRVLLESILLLDHKVIASCVTRDIMQFYGGTSQDLEGIVEQLRITEGIEAAIFLHEMEPCVYKVSMRANDCVDVSKIAKAFGGGGHIKAAGCTMVGTYYDILNNLLELIDMQLKELK